MIDHEHRVIFVHIQKCGGTAITLGLGQPKDCPEKHQTALQLRQLYGERIWDSYFKFGFVRNPWDRIVSWWTMINDMRPQFEKGLPVNKFQKYVLSHASTFEEFLENCDEEAPDTDGNKWIYRNQIDYLVDEAGQLMVDFVGRFEQIERDFYHVSKTIGREGLPLPLANRYRHRHYSRLYTEAMAEKVGERYARDISAFGYTFDWDWASRNGIKDRYIKA